MSKIEEKVENLIIKQIEKLGYKLYDVEYTKEGKDYYLRVYIEKNSGISLDDCEKVSNLITDILDEADYIKEQYFLEVSSTGIEKNLKKDKHLNDNLNQKVKIKLYKQVEGTKEVEGTLKSFNNKEIIIIKDEKTIIVLRENISQIKTVYDWN